MYSVHNEGKFVVAGRFIRILQNEIDKYMISISKNVNIVNKYNNTYHSTIKTRPVDVESDIYTDFDKNITKKMLSLKLMIMLKYQTIKTFLQTVMFQIGLKKLLLKKLKMLCRGHVLSVILTEKESLERFRRKY